MSSTLPAVPAALANFFTRHNRIALAFSGGVDSAYLLYAAKMCGADFHAYYVKSQFQPAFELEDAKRLAALLDAPLTVITLDILQNNAIAANPADRCYHCKHAIFNQLLAHAAKDGFTELMDGTNASDDADDRPGMRALAELQVLSPLRECGISKTEVRALSRKAGLFTWDKPAYACLATRIPGGTAITAKTLQKVEQSEAALAALGFTDFRVRVQGHAAKLQLPEKQFATLLEKHHAVRNTLLPYFTDILLDLNPRQGGHHE